MMPAPARSLLLACLLCLCQMPADAAKPSSKRKVMAQADAGTLYAGREDAMRLADEIAEQRGLDRAWVRQAIGQSRHLPQVARWVLPAASPTAKNWRVYRSRFIEPVRIRAGVAFWQANEAELARAQQTYGVPAEIIVGIIGVESMMPTTWLPMSAVRSASIRQPSGCAACAPQANAATRPKSVRARRYG